MCRLETAYLSTTQSTISDLHRAALSLARDDETVLTNVFTGRPARGIVNRVVRDMGPMSPDAPAFPTAAAATAPLRAAAEAIGSSDFSPLWAGQAARLSNGGSASELTRELASGALRAAWSAGAAASVGCEVNGAMRVVRQRGEPRLRPGSTLEPAANVSDGFTSFVSGRGIGEYHIVDSCL